MKFILIVFFVQHYNSAVIYSVEFDSGWACEQAAQAFHESGRESFPVVGCFPKGGTGD